MATGATAIGQHTYPWVAHAYRHLGQAGSRAGLAVALLVTCGMGAVQTYRAASSSFVGGSQTNYVLTVAFNVVEAVTTPLSYLIAWKTLRQPELPALLGRAYAGRRERSRALLAAVTAAAGAILSLDVLACVLVIRTLPPGEARGDITFAAVQSSVSWVVYWLSTLQLVLVCDAVGVCAPAVAARVRSLPAPAALEEQAAARKEARGVLAAWKGYLLVLAPASQVLVVAFVALVAVHGNRETAALRSPEGAFLYVVAFAALAVLDAATLWSLCRVNDQHAPLVRAALEGGGGGEQVAVRVALADHMEMFPFGIDIAGVRVTSANVMRAGAALLVALLPVVMRLSVE